MSISIKNTEHYFWGQNCEGWHLLKSGTLSVIQERMPPGTSEQLHAHRFAQQVFYVLSGIATFELNGITELVFANESIHVKPKLLHRIFNHGKDDLCFLVISEPATHDDRIEIVNYSSGLKEYIKSLNVEWLNKYFRVEPNDELQLSDPQAEILDKGGIIFYARHNHEFVGTAALLKIDVDTYELGKMAVTGAAQNLGIGSLLLDYSMMLARQMKIKKFILYSNTKLGAAIHLYKKYGFHEIKMEPGHYDRANIKMEKIF